MRGKISYCPVCGKELINIFGANGTLLYSVCNDSSCRIMIKDNHISEMDIEIYARLQEKGLYKAIQKSTEQYQNYMLLKEKLNGPLLSLLTSSPTESRKVAYNIVNAPSYEDALKYFSDKFKYSKIKPERVVRVRIDLDD